MSQNVHFRPSGLVALLQNTLALIGLTVAIYFFQDFLVEFYSGKRTTSAGTTINLVIVSIFLVGTVLIFLNIFKSLREEKNICQFFSSFSKDGRDPLYGIQDKSLIAEQYHFLKNKYDKHERIEADDLSSLLARKLAAQLVMPNYIANILILLGMLGTIVSLAIALLGASTIIENIDQVDDLGAILDGMSTALSTTMTGITSYIFLRFFISRQSVVQNNLEYMMDRITLLYLVPQWEQSPEKINFTVGQLIEKLHKVVATTEEQQTELGIWYKKLGLLIERNIKPDEDLTREMALINRNLREGFRLDLESKQ